MKNLDENCIIRNKGKIRFGRKRKSQRGFEYTEYLQKVINPRLRGDVKGELVWMIDTNLFKEDYEMFQVSLNNIKSMNF